MIVKLNNIWAVLNWGKYNPENIINEKDSLICYANQFWQKDFTNKSYFAY